MSEQILEIKPKHEILFKGSLKEFTTSCLTLRNPSEKKVYFKIKTTVPKRYCVRPNAGMLKPGESVTIEIEFVPYPYDPDVPPEFWSNHKFMVQSLYEPNEDFKLDELWRKVDSGKTKSMETRIVCGFEVINTDRKYVAMKSSSGILLLLTTFIFGFMMGRKWRG